jgi:E3 ubiquitin-protein ligase UBR4
VWWLRFKGFLPLQAEAREQYLSEKYGRRWLKKTIRPSRPLTLKLDQDWLKSVLFNPTSSSARTASAMLVEMLWQTSDTIGESFDRKREIINLMTSFLPLVGGAGESAQDYVNLYHTMLKCGSWRSYLALRGILPTIGKLIQKEITHLTRLEETMLSTDLSQVKSPGLSFHWFLVWNERMKKTQCVEIIDYGHEDVRICNGRSKRRRSWCE